MPYQGTGTYLDTRFGPMVHAKLKAAEENSGKLVSQVRRKAREIAESQGLECIITDGPPGVGCPVISSISGVDLALIVTEPTVAGVHDMERVLDLTRHFDVNAAVCINKCDLDEANTERIEDYCCAEEDSRLWGRSRSMKRWSRLLLGVNRR
jgi:MinD superfamily P-loop ATPase